MERRVDLARRARYEEMTRQELIAELLTDDLTGLGNTRKFEEDPRESVIVAIDVDGLKWVNDKLGHAAGDELLRATARALRSHGVRAYRLHGDEFIAQFGSLEEAHNVMHSVEETLCGQALFFDDISRRARVFRGAAVTWGVGATKEEADSNLVDNKRLRVRQGFRTTRGRRPPALTDLDAYSRRSRGFLLQLSRVCALF